MFWNRQNLINDVFFLQKKKGSKHIFRQERARTQTTGSLDHTSNPLTTQGTHHQELDIWYTW